MAVQRLGRGVWTERRHSGTNHDRRRFTCKQRHHSLGISQHQPHGAQAMLLKLQSARLE